ncbi:unnamed protein product [Staurois parvus]|uniref:Uncharacterized protein n=1 Tax=Staurois parvus TaxID=386267 RepID=A0ABN9EN04_9NEOB|nr:unnamed protein product [Staurois parvus]
MHPPVPLCVTHLCPEVPPTYAQQCPPTCAHPPVPSRCHPLCPPTSADPPVPKPRPVQPSSAASQCHQSVPSGCASQVSAQQ